MGVRVGTGLGVTVAIGVAVGVGVGVTTGVADGVIIGVPTMSTHVVRDRFKSGICMIPDANDALSLTRTA